MTNLQSLQPALVAIASAVLTFSILLFLLRKGWAWNIAVDIPNHRSLHDSPVPRIGGWGVVPTVVLLTSMFASPLRGVSLGVAALAIVSQIDDRRGLSARLRLAVHIFVVSIAVWAASVDVIWWLAILIALAIVWIVNLYNFMDGSNGLAGGMAIFGFGTYAIAALQLQPALAVAAASAAGAAAGFLVLNFPKAKVFLGDAGSIPLGFLAGILGFWGWQHGVWPIWFPGIVFAPFITDSTVTLLRRAVRGEKVWKAHREHYYQRLVQISGGHVPVALIYYVLMLTGEVLGLSALHASISLQWFICIVWYIVLAVVGLRIDRRWRRFCEGA